MGLQVLLILVLLSGLGLFAFWLWTLVDALRFSDADWERAGQSKLIWILLLVVLALLGSVLYVVMVRPTLTRATAS